MKNEDAFWNMHSNAAVEHETANTEPEDSPFPVHKPLSYLGSLLDAASWALAPWLFFGHFFGNTFPQIPGNPKFNTTTMLVLSLLMLGVRALTLRNVTFLWADEGGLVFRDWLGLRTRRVPWSEVQRVKYRKVAKLDKWIITNGRHVDFKWFGHGQNLHIWFQDGPMSEAQKRTVKTTHKRARRLIELRKRTKNMSIPSLMGRPTK